MKFVNHSDNVRGIEEHRGHSGTKRSGAGHRPFALAMKKNGRRKLLLQRRRGQRRVFWFQKNFFTTIKIFEDK